MTGAVSTQMSQAYTIQQLDPRTLIVDIDVRAEARPDRALVTSIRDARVLPPVKALHTADGGIRVRYGHRRILAAIEAGRETVPVLVSAAEEDKAGIMTQSTVDQGWASLPTTDKIASVGRLNTLGLSAAQIARRTKSPRRDVDAAIIASASKLAVKAAQRYEFLTLDQTAAVAEFENNKLAVSALIVAAHHDPANFNKVLECQHQRRARLQRARVNRVRIAGAKIAHPAMAGGSRDTQKATYVENYYRAEASSRTVCGSTD
jgi:ParB family chromosome partitioning protein